MATEATNERAKQKRRRVPVGAFRRATLAEYLGFSVASFKRLESAGALPAPSKLGGMKIWSRRTIDLWLAEGSPSRETFATMMLARRTNLR